MVGRKKSAVSSGKPKAIGGVIAGTKSTSRPARRLPQSARSRSQVANSTLQAAEMALVETSSRESAVETAASNRDVAPALAPWQLMLAGLGQRIASSKAGSANPKRRPRGPSLRYLIELSQQTHAVPEVRVYADPVDETDGQWWLESHLLTDQDLEDCFEDLPQPDRRLIDELLDLNDHDDLDSWDRYHFRDWRWHSAYSVAKQSLTLGDSHPEWLLRDLVHTGRLFWRVDADVQPEPLPVPTFWAEPLTARLTLQDAENDQIRLSIHLASGSNVVPNDQVFWAWESGLVLTAQGAGTISLRDVLWVKHFMQSGDQLIPAEQVDGLLHALVRIPELPPLEWPEHWALRRELGVPAPVLQLRWPKRLPAAGESLQLSAVSVFHYTQQPSEELDTHDLIYDSVGRRLLSRDPQREQQLLQVLLASGQVDDSPKGDLQVPLERMAELPSRLGQLGWTVQAEGRPLVMPGDFSWEVSSGLDWFDLSGGVTYANQIVPIPVLLQAIRRKENFVALDDGSHGMLPSRWAAKFGKLLELAETQGDSLRFGRPQALLLDSLLSEQEESSQVVVDTTFKKLRKELADFQGIAPGQAPDGFQGKLRKYQLDSLGWFQFLQKFGFGGCLADDMGLGKTVQVLALLEQRRSRRLKSGEKRKPTLVVVPKSLVFNWIDEAARFTPRLKVVDFTGLGRRDRIEQLDSAHVIVTTYGTLRKEVERISKMEFDYAILDEAQAIKNPKTDAAKACFLISADHRLAMTGTPIENHLGDLWSQFRFLNPGLLGHSEAFAAFSRGDCDPDSLQRLSQAVRPFILRRTKQQVLKELPKKTEQTIVCEMSTAQARQYNELREHFRLKLKKTVSELGIKRAAIHVLDALLRLRQAACDGRLVNPQKGARGAKLDLLLDQLEEVTSEGHKVLVFSQFTKLLGLLQKDLRKRRIQFEYLDGKTTNRKARVQRFQNDPKCPLFLISLKAGGHGLNLTAADYVYILDPWWNPAAEAQAVDRAHRMGQKKQVFAYRMITKGTVEEKILELQKSKRALAESIISGNNSLIRSLTADDLQMLLTR